MEKSQLLIFGKICPWIFPKNGSKITKKFITFSYTYWCTDADSDFNFSSYGHYDHNSKNWSQNQLKLTTQHQYINMYKKM